MQEKQQHKERWRCTDVLVKGIERSDISGKLKMGTAACCGRSSPQTTLYFPFAGNSPFPLVAVRGHYGGVL